MSLRDFTKKKIASPIVLAIVLGIVTTATFSPLLHAGFLNFDDNIFITNNQRVKSGITPDSIKWAFSNTDFGFYYPVTLISHMVDCQLFGLQPAFHHLTNIVIHVFNGILLFMVLISATGAKWKSWLVAMLFALHPMHVESVAWVAERKDLLSTFFLLLSLFAYVAYVKNPGLNRYLLTFLLLTLGLMAKSMIITAPLILLLLDIWPLNRVKGFTFQGKRRREADLPVKKYATTSKSDSPEIPKVSLARLFLEKLPFLVLSGIFGVVTILAQTKAKAVVSLGQFTVIERIGNSAVSYAIYLEKMFLPVNMGVLYTFPTSGWPLWLISVSIALLVLVSLLAIRYARKSPYFLVGWLIFLIFTFPVSGFIQTGQQAYADRYTYFSYTGLFIMVVWSVSHLISIRIKIKIVACFIASMFIVTLAVISWHQTGYWRNSVTLFSHTLRVNGPSYDILNCLGAGLIDEGKPAEATTYLKKATEFNSMEPGVWSNLGLAFYLQGKLKPSELCLRRAIKLSPRNGNAYLLLGDVLEGLGKQGEAMEAYESASCLLPTSPKPLLRLGLNAARRGQYMKASSTLRHAIQLDPADPNLRYYLAIVLAKMGDLGSAEMQLRKALKFVDEQRNKLLKDDITKRIDTLEKMRMNRPAQPPLHPDDP